MNKKLTILMTLLCLYSINIGNTDESNHEQTEVTDSAESNSDENTSEKLIEFFKTANSSVSEEVKKFKTEIEDIIKSVREDKEYKKDEQNGEKISAEADNIVQSIGSSIEILDSINKNFDGLSELLTSIKKSLDVLKEGKFPEEQSTKFKEAFKNIGEKISNIYSNTGK